MGPDDDGRPPWWLAPAQGAAFTIAALVLLTEPGADHLLTLLALLGACWLTAGVLDLADLRRGGRWGRKLAGAAVGLGTGLFVLRQPLWSTLLVPTTLLTGVAVCALANGAVALLRAWAGGGPPLAAVGGLDVVMGAILLTGSPRLALWGGAAWAVLAGVAVLVSGLRIRPAPAPRPDRQLAG